MKIRKAIKELASVFLTVVALALTFMSAGGYPAFVAAKIAVILCVVSALVALVYWLINNALEGFKWTK